jgi:hypothetical protein
MYNRANQERTKFSDGRDSVQIGSFRVQAPPPAVSTGARIENVQLDGYDRLDSCGNAISSACELAVRLVWRALANMSEDATVFTHVVAPDGTVVAQSDSPPVAGSDPTSGWSNGDTIADARRIQLPASLPPGRYRVVTGLYRPEGGQRLNVDNDRSGANEVELFQFDRR